MPSKLSVFNPQTYVKKSPAPLVPRALIPYLAVLGVIWLTWYGLHDTSPAAAAALVPDTTTNRVSEPNPPSTLYNDIKDGLSSALIPHSSRSKFIDKAMQTTLFGSTFDPSPIEKLCSSHVWPSDLVFTCDKVIGGVGNVRQEVLACVRYAMHIGAGMLLPPLHPRRASNSSRGESTANSYSGSAGLLYLLDQEIFLQRMGEACPQMRFWESVDELKKDTKGEVVGMGVMGGTRGKMDKAKMRPVEVEWISAHRAPVGSVSLVTFGRQFADYEICQDGQEFADSFGRIAEMRPDTRRLAAAVLFEMSKRFKLNLDPQQAINKNSYMGIHLRTSADAMTAGWMSWEVQSKLYLKYATRYKDLPVIYIATGNLTTVGLFGELIAPVPVVTKFDLLTGDDATLLQSLAWDQQAEVDYILLSKASQFLGTADSSFSWGIASARHTLTAEGTCGGGPAKSAPAPGRLGKRLEADISMDDGLTIMIGADNKLHFKRNFFWP